MVLLPVTRCRCAAIILFMMRVLGPNAIDAHGAVDRWCTSRTNRRTRASGDVAAAAAVAATGAALRATMWLATSSPAVVSWSMGLVLAAAAMAAARVSLRGVVKTTCCASDVANARSHERRNASSDGGGILAARGGRAWAGDHKNGVRK